MKKTKIGYVILMTLVLHLCFTISAGADVTDGKCGSKCTYTYDSETNELVISGKGQITITPWKSKEFYNEIKSVIIENGITAIKEEKAFYKCANLRKVTMDSSVEKISDNAFSQCKKIKEVVFPGVKKIGAYAFYNCGKLENVSLSENIENIGKYAFCNTSLGGEVLIRKDCRYGYCAFRNTKLKKVEYEEGIENISRLVSNCNLEEIKLPESAVTIETCAFRSCGFKSIKIPDRVERICSYAFMNCTSLKRVQLPSSLQDLSRGAFLNCINLKKVIIPSGVKVISNGAFRRCSKLEAVKIPDGVEVVENGAFESCISLKKIKLPSSLTKIAGYAFCSCEKITEIRIPKNVEFIGTNAFTNDSNLKMIIIRSRKLNKLGWRAFNIATGKEYELEILVPNNKKTRYSAIINKSMGEEMKYIKITAY